MTPNAEAVWNFVRDRRGTLYNMIKDHFSDWSEEALHAAIDELWEAELLIQVNGWFAAQQPPKKTELTSDDIAWLTGTGRYSQG